MLIIVFLKASDKEGLVEGYVSVGESIESSYRDLHQLVQLRNIKKLARNVIRTVLEAWLTDRQ